MFEYLLSLYYWYPERFIAMCLCFVVSSGVNVALCYYFIKKNKNKQVSASRCIIVAGIYCELLFMLTIGCRTPSVHYKLLFWPTVFSWNVIRDCIQNVILFIPAGILISQLFGTKHCKTVLLCAGISFAVEIIQLVFRIGYFEILDLLTNTLGGVVGILLFKILKKLVLIIRG